MLLFYVLFTSTFIFNVRVINLFLTRQKRILLALGIKLFAGLLSTPEDPCFPEEMRRFSTVRKMSGPLLRPTNLPEMPEKNENVKDHNIIDQT